MNPLILIPLISELVKAFFAIRKEFDGDELAAKKDELKTVVKGYQDHKDLGQLKDDVKCFRDGICPKE